MLAHHLQNDTSFNTVIGVGVPVVVDGILYQPLGIDCPAYCQAANITIVHTNQTAAAGANSTSATAQGG